MIDNSVRSNLLLPLHLPLQCLHLNLLLHRLNRLR